MSFFSRNTTKAEAIAEGLSDLVAEAVELQNEVDEHSEAVLYTDLLDAIEERRRIIAGFHPDFHGGLLTLDEHREALQAIDATPKEWEEYKYREMMETHTRDDDRLSDFVEDNEQLVLRRAFHATRTRSHQV